MKHFKTFLSMLMVICFLGGQIEAKDKKFKNGDFYSGEWQKGKPEGKGKMIFANGSVYDGVWRDGKIAGVGSFEGAGMRFEGTFIPVYNNEILVNFKPVRGTLTSPDSRMEGEWDENNLFHGILSGNNFSFKGVIDIDKNSYKEGRIDGKDGSYIEGTMLLTPQFEGKMEKYVLQNSPVLDVPAVYTGVFKNGKYVGLLYGPKLSDTINEFQIEIKDNGNQYGSLTQKNGGKYQGYIKNKKYDGEGVLSLNSGSFSGMWDKGILYEGEVKQIDQNGKTYDFSVTGGKVIYTFPNGDNITLSIIPDGKSNLYSEVEKYQKEHVAITVKEPNTILSYINPLELDKICYLTIIGFLYDTDIKILNRCTNLKTLDLRKAIITISPETQKQRREKAEFANAFFGALAGMSETKHKAGETKSETVAFAKMLSTLADMDLKNTNKGIDDCGIPEDAFSKLKNLQSVKLPLTATYIGRGAFSDCPSLSDVELPPYLKRVGIGAFDNTAITKVVLPATVETLGDYWNGACAFGGNPSLELLDAGNCSFKNYTWEDPLYRCKKLVLPKNIQYIKSLSLKQGSELYCPTTLKEFGNSLYNLKIYVQSKVAIPGNLYDCTIYVPEGGMTSWYAKYGDRNTIIEGTKERP